MAKGYTSAGIVAKHLGKTLTAEQLTMFDFIFPAVEEFIDAKTGSAWLTGAVTSESHIGPFGGPLVFLRQRPVSAVSSVTALTSWNAVPTTLVAATDYGLQDAARGVLYVPAYTSWHTLTVTYTPAASLPWTINRAATLLAAAMLAPVAGAVDPGLVKSYSVGSDLTVTYRDDVAGAVTPEVRRLLHINRARLIA